MPAESLLIKQKFGSIGKIPDVYDAVTEMFKFSYNTVKK